MQLVEVSNRQLADEFLYFPIELYRDDPNWIRPLDKDVSSVFDPEKNSFFNHGDCIRWVLRREGKTIGRVAAFINENTAHTFKQPTGGMGFFECIEDEEAAFMLFDACKAWLEARGMKAMDGPINFGDRDRWWGLLVDGFYEPNYCMHYHFPYYQGFFEKYGFKNYFNQYTYRTLNQPDSLSKKVSLIAERLNRNPNYSYRHIKKDRLDEFMADFREIYNQAWVKHDGVKPMTEQQAKNIAKEMKPIIDERLMWFAYYEDRPIGFYIMLPELNKIFKHVNGKLNFLGVIKFLYHRWRGTCKTMFGLVFGVIPDFQNKGVEAGLIHAFSQISFKKGFPYKDLEMNWIGDFNPKMNKVMEITGAKIHKTHVTYRKIFDPSIPFERAPVIE
ncbi:MAG: hypothetical protein LAT68_06360 [Cyclobacteriaceae bacterium]|nr:hypothetical protein [Cyclobacteriaceae bacterium]